jgi:DNA-binding NarL/FixJ family response regulator
MSSIIEVLCVEDHIIVREGISLIVDREPDMQVIGLAATGEEAVEFFKRRSPDVTLMDLQLGRMSGVDAIRAIRKLDSRARIIALTMYQGEEDIFRALEAGAAAYLLKDALSGDLIRMIREVYAGRGPIVPPEVKARLTERSTHPKLTPRERQVLELMAIGMRNREIGESLGIVEETVEVHVTNILTKLDVRDRTAAAHVAVRRGIIHIR